MAGAARRAARWVASWAVPGLGMFNESYYIFSVGNFKPIWTEEYPSCWKACAVATRAVEGRSACCHTLLPHPLSAVSTNFMMGSAPRAARMLGFWQSVPLPALRAKRSSTGFQQQGLSVRRSCNELCAVGIVGGRPALHPLLSLYRVVVEPRV